jgi:hypothetical protein
VAHSCAAGYILATINFHDQAKTLGCRVPAVRASLPVAEEHQQESEHFYHYFCGEKDRSPVIEREPYGTVQEQVSKIDFLSLVKKKNSKTRLSKVTKPTKVTNPALVKERDTPLRIKASCI